MIMISLCYLFGLMIDWHVFCLINDFFNELHGIAYYNVSWLLFCISGQHVYITCVCKFVYRIYAVKFNRITKNLHKSYFHSNILRRHGNVIGAGEAKPESR